MLQINHGSKRPRSKSTKLTSQIHRFRPRSRKNEISDISPGQKCVIQMEMSDSRISCTLNGVRRSSWEVVWVTKWNYASETSFKWQIFCSCSWRVVDRTSPRSIPCAWNSRIWHFHVNNTLSPQRNVWNLVFATSRSESMNLTCQFRRFWARTFRPVVYL